VIEKGSLLATAGEIIAVIHVGANTWEKQTQRPVNYGTHMHSFTWNM